MFADGGDSILIRAEDLEENMDVIYEGCEYVVTDVKPYEHRVWLFLDVVDVPENEHVPCSVQMPRGRLVKVVA